MPYTNGEINALVAPFFDNVDASTIRQTLVVIVDGNGEVQTYGSSAPEGDHNLSRIRHMMAAGIAVTAMAQAALEGMTNAPE